jgi:predicted esterase
MAINVAIVCPNTLGGVIGLSGHVFPSLIDMLRNSDKEMAAEMENKKKNLSFFLYHGKSDPLIQEMHAAKTYEFLKEFGFEKIDYTSEEFLEHSVSRSEQKKMTAFLKRVMTD